MAELATIERPIGALAVHQQRLEKRTVSWPLGFRPVSDHAAQVLSSQPARSAAMWFRELHEGFRSAQFLQVTQAPTDAGRLVHAEAAELCAWHTAPNRVAPGPDRSLPPRPLGVWVCVDPLLAPTATGARVLDACAHWAHMQDKYAKGDSLLAHLVRISVVTGTCARTFLERAVAEGALKDVLDASPKFVAVGVRWINAQGIIQTRVLSEAGPPATGDLMLRAIQRLALRLCAEYSIPYPASLALPLLSQVPRGQYQQRAALTDAAFAARLESPDSVTLTPAAATPGAATLTQCGVAVRLSQKRLGDDGLTHESAFHGALLAFDSAKEQAAVHCGGDAPLDVPIGADEESMGLHVCAVQAKKESLEQAVSLYGLRGKPGMPINPPGSWVYNQSAALRPVDGALLATWDVRPVAPKSLEPGEAALAEAYRMHFARAGELYLRLGDQSAPELASASSSRSASGLELTALIEPPPPAPETDPVTAHRNRQLCALMQLNPFSQRTTLGEAYAHLFESDAPPEVLRTMTHAMGQLPLGVSASLLDMHKFIQRSVTASHHVQQRALDDAESSKRIAAACLAALRHDCADQPLLKRPRANGNGLAMPVDRLRRAMDLLGLKKGLEVVLKPGMNAERRNKAAQVVASALGVAPLGARLDATSAACTALEGVSMHRDEGELGDWLLEVEKAVATAVGLLACGNGVRNRPTFLITRDGADADAAVRSYRCALKPLLEPLASPFAVLEAAAPCVLLLQFSRDDAQLLLAATVRKKTA